MIENLIEENLEGLNLNNFNPRKSVKSKSSVFYYFL